MRCSNGLPSHQLHIRVTDALYSSLSSASSFYGISVNDYVRLVLHSAVSSPPSGGKEDDDTTTYQ